MHSTKGISSVLALALAGGCSSLCAQDPNPTQQNPQQTQQDPQQPTEIDPGVPLYRIQVVARDIPAINYFHRKESTKIGFRGTDLLP